jgi:predicted phage terminase large subunit-like protein
VDRDGTIWILPDVIWERCAPDDFVNASIELVKRRKPLIWAAEKGHISKSIGPFWKKSLIEAGVHLRIEEVTPSGDKVMRAQNILGRMAMGRVRFPTFAPWWPEAQAELLSFPAGKHDDFVDALAHLGGIVDKMVPCYQDAKSEFERQVREWNENEQSYEIPGGHFG